MKNKIAFNETLNDYMVLISTTALTLLEVYNRDTKCSCGGKLYCSTMWISENGFDFWIECPDCHKETRYFITNKGVVYEKEYSRNVYDPITNEEF